MNQQNYQIYRDLKNTADEVFKIKTTIGGGLIVVGGAMAIWIIQVINKVVYSPEKMPLLRTILKISYENPKVQLPENSTDIVPFINNYGDAILAYGILIFLLSIAAGIAKAFLSGGINLIGSDLKILLEKMGEQMGRQ